MKRALLDVHLDIPLRDVTDVGQEDFWRQAFEKSRETAASMAAQAGGWLDATVLPEITSRFGEHVLLGGDWLLLGTRWTCEVPDSADVA